MAGYGDVDEMLELELVLELECGVCISHSGRFDLMLASVFQVIWKLERIWI